MNYETAPCDLKKLEEEPGNKITGMAGKNPS